jgi:hypothetical protein
VLKQKSPTLCEYGLFEILIIDNIKEGAVRFELFRIPTLRMRV